MRIALTHPFCWPYVRRGAERIMDETGRYLTERGYEVITVSTKPGRSRVETTEAGKRILHRQLWSPFLAKLRITPFHPFVLTSLCSIVSAQPDVVHSFFFMDGFAANLARRYRRHKTVLQMLGAPVPAAYHRRFPPDRWLIRESILGADERITCSRFVAELIEHHYGVTPDVVVPPVNVSRFTPGKGPRDGRPTLLAVADFTVRRKGVRVLAKAFCRVAEKLPEVRLRLSGRMTEALRHELLDGLSEKVRDSVETLGLGDPSDVPRQYREASLLVLPSMWEPSGNAMFEAWASGTPVVATRHGGLPEFMEGGVGVLFDPQTDGEETMNVEGLTEAILEGLKLSAKPGVRERCRSVAERYSWESIGPRLEELYQG